MSCSGASQPRASVYLLLHGEMDHAHQPLFGGQQMGNRPWLGRALAPASGCAPSTYQVLQCIQGLQKMTQYSLSDSERMAPSGKNPGGEGEEKPFICRRDGMVSSFAYLCSLWNSVSSVPVRAPLVGVHLLTLVETRAMGDPNAIGGGSPSALLCAPTAHSFFLFENSVQFLTGYESVSCTQF